MGHSIGVFDSGLGGLSVLREIHARLPDADLHYVADSAWCPYGPRPAGEIQARTARITDHLLAKGVEAVVVACNSATISAIEHLRAAYPITFIGMEPAVKPAAALTVSGTIGVMATEASLAGEKFHHLVQLYAGRLRVLTRPCPEFVSLVEAGELAGLAAEEAVAFHVDALLEEGADVLILGCSHYPFLRDLIEARVAGRARVLDTGAPVTQRLITVLGSGHSLPANGRVSVETTGDLALLRGLLPVLCPEMVAETSLATELIP